MACRRGGKLPEEVLDQRRDVSLRSRKRRHVDHEDRDPVVEVLAEEALPRPAASVLVGRRDHADVRPDRLGAPDPDELAVLDDAQELRLQDRLQLAELVDEERAGVREREARLALLHGSVNAPLT
jgi:hypothetical protein